MTFRLGIDVGGTHTDAVCVKVDGGVPTLVSSHKTESTPDLINGLITAAEKCLEKSPSKCNITSVMIGTTYFLNSVVQRSDQLGRVVIIRLGGRFCKTVPPFSDFPRDLSKLINGGHFDISGGYDFNGCELGPTNDDEIERIASQIQNDNTISGVVISCPFSNVNPTQEAYVRQQLRKCWESADRSIHITCTHDTSSSPDMLKRENAAIINGSLLNYSTQAMREIGSSVNAIKGLEGSSVFLTQNDGTIMTLSEALQCPIKTFGSGPTNSSRGAAYLIKQQFETKISETGAAVVDIGGTTSDITILDKNLFPRQRLDNALLGGVRTNFRMPDVTSFGLGGGSHVNVTTSTVGPTSVGHRLCSPHGGQAFGGTQLTATDVAIKLKTMTIPGADPSLIKITEDDANTIQRTMVRMIEDAVADAKTSSDDLPLILVGGGAALLSGVTKVEGCSEILTPKHFDVANALGASISQLGAEFDQIVIVEGSTRETQLSSITSKLEQTLLKQGALPTTLQTVRKEDNPIPYAQNESLRIIIKIIAERGEKEPDQITLSDHKQVPSKESAPIKNPITLSEEDKEHETRFDYVGLQPDITDGMWNLNAIDINCLSVGAGILGCGGGGSTYSSRLKLLACLEKGGKLTVAPTSSLTTKDSIYCCGFVGAPNVLLEKMGSAEEIENSLKAVEERTGKKATHLISAEIGGANCLEPLLQASIRNIPYVDADGMGRAFPLVYQWIPRQLGGKKLTGFTMADCDQSVEYKPDEDTNDNLIAFLGAEVVRLGCCAGISFPPLDVDEVNKYSVPLTVSQAWSLGRTVLSAQQQKQCPIDAVIGTQPGGKLLFQGRISEVQKQIVGHHLKGTLVLASPEGKQCKIYFQNENLIVLTDSGECLATTPDLICVLNTDTGHTIGTDEYAYGLLVSVVVLPAPDVLKSEKMMEVVGPHAFGYTDIEFKPIGTHKAYSVWDQ